MKLYIIVQSDLPAGLKMAQAIHAQRAFAAEHPALEQDWFENSNNIVVLQHEDLGDLMATLQDAGIALSPFHEPDLDNRLTAICAEPRARDLLRRLPLATEQRTACAA